MMELSAICSCGRSPLNIPTSSQTPNRMLAAIIFLIASILSSAAWFIGHSAFPRYGVTDFSAWENGAGR